MFPMLTFGQLEMVQKESEQGGATTSPPAHKKHVEDPWIHQVACLLGLGCSYRFLLHTERIRMDPVLPTWLPSTRAIVE